MTELLPSEDLYTDEDGSYWVIVDDAPDALRTVMSVHGAPDLFGTTYTVERMAVRLTTPDDPQHTDYDGEYVIECMTDHPAHVECWKVTVDE
jgi:hypothetical protein